MVGEAGGRLAQATVWELIDADGQLAPGLLEVKASLGVLAECDQEVVQELIVERGHGRDDYPVVAMWQLMAVHLFLRKGRFSDLIAELRRNRDFARLLGFKEVLRLEDHCLRGWKAISLRVLLAATTLNLRTLLAIRAQRAAKPAQQQRRAAA